MNTPHKDACLLRAIADGKQMQTTSPFYHELWLDVSGDMALEQMRLGFPVRIKPDPKPDVVRFMVCATNFNVWTLEVAQDLIKRHASLSGIVKVVIDGETNKPKSAEVVS
jgi:hypothetical protein